MGNDGSNGDISDMESRLTSLISGNTEYVLKRIDGVKKDIDGVKKDIGNLKEDVKRVDQKVDSTQHHLKVIEGIIMEQNEKVGKMDGRIHKLEKAAAR